MPTTFKNRELFFNLGLILLFELFSVFAYYFPTFNNLAFFIISVLFIIVTAKKLETGILLLILELLIGSKGYLLALTVDGLTVSLRISLWLIVLSFWLVKFLREWWQTKEIPLKNFFKFKYAQNYLFLAVFIIIGLMVGISKHQDFGNLFFDINGWLYFILILPLYDIFGRAGNYSALWEKLRNIFGLAVLWIIIKTLIFLFIFSHNFIGIEFDLYRWLRTTGVGEVTKISNNFYRIFFQNHLFVVFGFIFSFLYTLRALLEKNTQFKKINLFIFSVLSLTVVILSMSRSFWVGLAAALGFLYLLILKRFGFKKILLSLGTLIVTIIVSFGVIALIVKFPYPQAGEFDLSLFSERASLDQGEAAVSSRWQLLAALKKELKAHPLLGQGYGATVTYQSSDPRVLETSADGQYTTYAFEWGYLDIWLKIGLFGLLTYLALLLKLFKEGLINIRSNTHLWFNYALLGCLLALGVINIFTPYLNHPLGITPLMLMSLLL